MSGNSGCFAPGVLQRLGWKTVEYYPAQLSVVSNSASASRGH
ncbi:hypothetical protein ACVXHA_20920 [Escherichia coli]